MEKVGVRGRLTVLFRLRTQSLGRTSLRRDERAEQ